MAKAANSEIVRIGKFGLVGVVNTAVDFVILNLLSRGSNLTSVLIRSNLISTTVAMIFSFFANRRWVFKSDKGSLLKESLLFLGFTAFGLYVLQSGAIYILTTVWTAPIDFGLKIAHLIHLGISDEFLVKNGAKAAATLVSMSWNYITYKRFVFHS